MRTDDQMSSRADERRAVSLLLGGCALLVAAGVAFSTLDAVTQPANAALALGDVAEAQIVEIRDQHGVTLLSGEFRSRVDAVGNTEKDAALMDRRGRRVLGEVEIEIPAAGRGERRPELEVDIIELPPRATFTVVIDDRTVGSFVSDDRGSIDMELQEGELPAP